LINREDAKDTKKKRKIDPEGIQADLVLAPPTSQKLSGSWIF
jgi:hypothetical protein